MRCNPFLARLDQDNVLVDGINEMMSGCIQFGFSIIQLNFYWSIIKVVRYGVKIRFMKLSNGFLEHSYLKKHGLVVGTE